MNKPNDIEERFRQLEREVMGAQGTPPPQKRAEPEWANGNPIPGLDVEAAKSGFSGLVNWVNGLTGATKIVAIVIIGVAAFGVISFLFRLVTAAISLGIMAVVAFILYKVFFEPNSTPPKS